MVAKKKVAPKKKTGWTEVDPKTSPEDLVAMATGKKKAPAKKRAVKKKLPTNTRSKTKVSAVSKTVASSKNAKKKVPVKSSNRVVPNAKQTAHTKKRTNVKKKAPVKKRVVKKKSGARTKAERKSTPIPKYHLNHQSWNKEEAMIALCEIIVSSSNGLDTICKNNKDLPSLSSIMNWLDEEARIGGGPLLERYARAKESQADYLADEMIDIADNQVSEPLVIDGVVVKVGDEIIRVITAASVNHARLRVDTRKFVAAKLKPQKYGDKLELSGNPDRPLAGQTDEQLALRRRVLEDKLAEHAPK